MKTCKLAIIGFGNVGQGLASILSQKHDFLKQHFDIDIQIVAVCDQLKGSLANPAGLDPSTLLAAIEQQGHLNDIDAPQRDWDAEQTIANSGADMLVELAYTDLQTGEPALSHIKQAIAQGMHISMTNKGPVALQYTELQQLAKHHGVSIGIEGTVMSGTPALSLGSQNLLAAGIEKIQGILNGTTNYILGEMENGASYSAALQQAQELGYAEADPTGDVEGHDAAAKVVILGNLLMGLQLTLSDIDRTGISGLTPADIASAAEENCRWKLIGSVLPTAEGYQASVRPEKVSLEHPLAGIGGATNAITYSTALLGDITLVGPGAGRMETGYAVIEDVLGAYR